jgi:hypothetical protein
VRLVWYQSETLIWIHIVKFKNKRLIGMGMADIHRLKRRLKVANSSVAVIGVLWIAILALMVSSFSGQDKSSNLLTGHVVAGQTVYTKAPSWANTFSLIVYVAGFVLLGGAMFMMTRHSGELKTVLKKEEVKKMLSSDPRAALAEFLEILSTWSIKNTNAELTLGMLQEVKKNNKTKLPKMGCISLCLTNAREDIAVAVSGKLTWKEVFAIFHAYLHSLEIDKERLVHIAEYLGKEDLSIALSMMDEQVSKKEAAEAEDELELPKLSGKGVSAKKPVIEAKRAKPAGKQHKAKAQAKKAAVKKPARSHAGKKSRK